jgi:hypothetical protein
MDQSIPQNDLRAALTSFETNLVTPVVSGELADWIEKMKKSWSTASASVHYHTKHLHPRQYEEISQADPALFQQIELLKAEDEVIEQEREKINQAVTRVAQHVPKMEPDEAKAQPHVEGLMNDGTSFVTRVRKQEVAVQTWFSEAFNRERGGGD